MAKGKPNGDAPQTPRSRTSRPRRDKEKPEQDQDVQPINESGERSNPEWWRGDPGKRGEVL